MTDLRREGVTVDVGSLADDLVADVGVAGYGIASLHCLEDGGWRGDRVHGRCLRDQTLAVHRGQGWHGGERGHGSHAGGVGGHGDRS